LSPPPQATARVTRYAIGNLRALSVISPR
jgi:hypothetical protein